MKIKSLYKQSGRWLACFVLVTLSEVAYGQVPANTTQSSGQSTTANALERVIVGTPVVKSLLWYSNQPARLVPIEQTPIYSRLSGYVGRIEVDIGDQVSAGATLLTLEMPELKAELQQKKASAEQSRAITVQAAASVDLAKAAVVAAEARVREAEAGTARAVADVRRWTVEMQRWQELANQGAVNRQVLDETQQKLDSAKASMEETKANIESANAAVLQAQAEVKKAEADLELARAGETIAAASVNVAETMLGYTVLRSPFDGIVVQRNVDPGHFSTPSGNATAPMMTIARTDVIRVYVNIPETETGYVALGSPVTIQIPALRGTEIQAKVTRTAWALSESNRSLETIIDVPNPNGLLRPGMYALAKVLLANRPQALTLPTAAVMIRDGQASCCKVVNQKIVISPLRLGVKVGDDWEVVEGLLPEDKVALNKAATLKDGQMIDPLPVPK